MEADTAIQEKIPLQLCSDLKPVEQPQLKWSQTRKTGLMLHALTILQTNQICRHLCPSSRRSPSELDT